MIRIGSLITAGLLVACGAGLPPPSTFGGVTGGGAGGGAGGAPKEARPSTISALRFRASDGGPWLMSPVLPVDTSRVVCRFAVRGVAPGREVVVVWRRGTQELVRTEHLVDRDTRTLSSQVDAESPLGSGTYEVEVRVADRRAASTSFRIAGEDQPAPAAASRQGPRVFDLTLAREACAAGPSSRRQVTKMARGVTTVHLCLKFEGIRRGQRLDVRWHRRSSASEPLAVTTFNPDGSGQLSAAYNAEEPLPAGRYEVVVVLGGRQLARERFVVLP
jgi:hypothetical protein